MSCQVGLFGCSTVRWGSEKNWRSQQIPQLAMMDEETDSPNPQAIWNFDCMLRGRLTDGLEVPFHAMPNLEF